MRVTLGMMGKVCKFRVTLSGLSGFHISPVSQQMGLSKKLINVISNDS